MTSWFSSLHVRLITSFVVVLLLSLGGLTLFASYLAQREGERFASEVERARSIRVIQEGERLTSPTPEPSAGQSSSSQIGGNSNLDWYLLIIDSEGQVMGTSQKYEVPQPGESDLAWIVPLNANGESAGRLMVRPMGPNETTLEAPSPRLVSAFRSSFLWTGLVAGALGIGLIYFMTRRMLIPIGQLTAAAHKVGTGQPLPEIPSTGKDEIAQLTQTFNAMTSRLTRMELERQRMLADVAHELRTPLTNANGYLEAIKDGLKQPDSETINSVHRQILQLHRLVDDLRLLTLAESGELELSLELQPLADVLDAAVAGFEPRAQGKGIDLYRKYPQDLPAILMDRSRIAQVIGNLLDNAIRHTPDGGSVTVNAASTEDNVVVTVSDTGEGIPPDALPRVFDRLYRHDNSRNRVSGGSGLGLSIVEELVQAHGGSMGVESEVGIGSSFSFSLPRRPGPLARRRTPSNISA
jgi:two-component system sensor histidine kinase BaeS